MKVKNIEPVVNINTDSESVLVKGLLFILDCYVNGKNSNEILSINEKDLMEEIGMKNIVTSQRNGSVSSSFPISSEDEIIISTDKGKVIRTNVKDIRIAGRNTQGVRIIKLSNNEKVVSTIKIEDNFV